jgi:hypothetical protein
MEVAGGGTSTAAAALQCAGDAGGDQATGRRRGGKSEVQRRQGTDVVGGRGWQGRWGLGVKRQDSFRFASPSHLCLFLSISLSLLSLLLLLAARNGGGDERISVRLNGGGSLS